MKGVVKKGQKLEIPSLSLLFSGILERLSFDIGSLIMP